MEYFRSETGVQKDEVVSLKIKRTGLEFCANLECVSYKCRSLWAHLPGYKTQLQREKFKFSLSRGEIRVTAVMAVLFLWLGCFVSALL